MRWQAAFVLAAGIFLALPAQGDDPLDAVAAEVERAPALALERLDKLAPSLASRTDARYLRARLLERLGHDARALEALPPPDATLPPGVVLDLSRRRAALLARTGRCDEALPLLEGLARDGAATPAVTRAGVECALARGDVEAARRGLGALDADDEALVLRIRLADVLLARGARDEAAGELRALAVAHPAHARATEAERRLQLLGGESFSRGDRLARAEKLIEARQYEASLVELDAAGKAPDPADKARELHLRGMTLYRLRTRYAEAAHTLETAARLGGVTEASDAFHAASARSRAGENGKAIAAFRAFARRHPKSRFAADARFQAAWLELRLGRDAGERNMRSFVEGPDARRERALVRAGRFELAWRAFERGRHAEAEKAFAASAREEPSAMSSARGHYWAGRAAQAAHRARDAVGHLRLALAREPLGWYALLARERLRELDVDPGAPFDAPAVDRAPARAETPTKAAPHAALPPEVDFFARLGLSADAVARVRAAEPGFGRDETGTSALVRAYLDLGEAARPHRLVVERHATLLRRQPSPAQAWAWEAAYPRPHAELVAEAARTEKLEPELVYAVMRKESGFDEQVVSSADAIGLMQLLPATAAKVAAELGDVYRREALFEPDHNVRWGAHLLGSLVERFGGEPVLALAAYNAGAHQVEPWLAREAARARAGGGVELDRFVERIPITQTRNYVRRVVAAWASYRYLADPARGWPFELSRELALSPASSAARRR